MNPRPQRQRPGSSSPVARPPLRPNPEPIKVGDQLSAPPPAHSQTPELPESVTAGQPKYQTLPRKEARLRGDQIEELARLRRRINKGRHDRTERVTDNTLIRVAVDLLLAHAEQLHGDTEDELRDSVTPELRNPDAGRA
ncbi:hypothetical protein ACWDKQ_35790 [Saccharopolyspora sp. NPDC000995]